MVSFAFRADTLELLEPVVSWARGLAGVDSAARRLDLRGTLRADGRVTGTLRRWKVQGDLEADSTRVATGGFGGAGSLLRCMRAVRWVLGV
jgi:hypothetical protein